MNDNATLNPQDPTHPAAEPHLDLEMVLEEYRRRQMIEHLTGPLLSIGLHLVVLVACFFLLGADKEVRSATDPFVSVVISPKVIDPVPEPEKATPEPPDPTQYSTSTTEMPPADPSQAVGDPESGSIGDFSQDVPSSADSGEIDKVLDVKMTDGALRISDIFGGRRDSGINGKPSGRPIGSPRNRPNTDIIVKNGLQWLKDHQNEDGSWSKSYPASMCGLALLAYLAHGELAESPRFGTTVSKAINYLSYRMNAVDAGQPVKDGADAHAYTHAIVTYALAEAYGMTKSPTLKPVMDKGLDTIIAGQQSGGGWDYNYAKGTRWDLSFSGWQIQALKTGLLAGSNNTSLPEAIQKSINFLQKTAFKDGVFHYSSDTKGHTDNMQGVGLLCLQMLGQKESPEAKAATKWINENIKVVWNDQKREKTDLAVNFDPYGWYYHTQAMFYAGGSVWKGWDEQFNKEIRRAQQPDGHWDAPPARGGIRAAPMGDLEPYYATTLCCLMLEVYYRFLPSAVGTKTDHRDVAEKIGDLVD